MTKRRERDFIVQLSESSIESVSVLFRTTYVLFNAFLILCLTTNKRLNYIASLFAIIARYFGAAESIKQAFPRVIYELVLFLNMSSKFWQSRLKGRERSRCIKL